MCLQDAAAAGRAGRMERRWAAILGPGTWPEVLRRYALTRSGAQQPTLERIARNPMARLLTVVHSSRAGPSELGTQVACSATAALQARWCGEVVVARGLWELPLAPAARSHEMDACILHKCVDPSKS